MREILERLLQTHFCQELTITFQAQNPKNVVTKLDPLEGPMDGATWDRHCLQQGSTPAHYTS
ncbi:MAG TPA: hypothetical protein VOA64_15710 [Candidatus Dormibacteraeota bacterium]|nr:hypothetical protein [Candidatus Dormibacteraeota bacterium]